MLVSRDGREIGPRLDVFMYNIFVVVGIILVVTLLVRFSGQPPQKLDLIPTSCVLCVLRVCVCAHKKTSRERQREWERDRWMERLNILIQIGIRKMHSQNTFGWKGGAEREMDRLSQLDQIGFC